MGILEAQKPEETCLVIQQLFISSQF